MKALLIQVEGPSKEVLLDPSDYLGDARLNHVFGWVEFVYVPGTTKILMVDEEGLLKRLALNRLASELAGRRIVGPALLVEGKDLK